MVPVADVGLKVRLELLERAPVAAAEELVLQMAEDLLGGAVVQAVALARHVLDEAVLREPPHVGHVLVPPAHVRVRDQADLLGLRLHGHPQHLLLVRQVGMQGYRVRHDLLAAEVVNRRQVRPAEGELELGDVGAHLPPEGVGGEVAAEHVLEGLADPPPVGAVPVAVGLAAYAAPQPHLAHHLEHRLVRDADAVDGAQLHGDLPVAHAVGEPAEELGDPRPELRPGRALGVRKGVVVGRHGRGRHLEQVGQGEAPRKRGYGRRSVPSGKPSSVFRAIDFLVCFVKYF